MTNKTQSASPKPKTTANDSVNPRNTLLAIISRLQDGSIQHELQRQIMQTSYVQERLMEIEREFICKKQNLVNQQLQEQMRYIEFFETNFVPLEKQNQVIHFLNEKLQNETRLLHAEHEINKKAVAQEQHPELQKEADLFRKQVALLHSFSPQVQVQSQIQNQTVDLVNETVNTFTPASSVQSIHNNSMFVSFAEGKSIDNAEDALSVDLANDYLRSPSPDN